MDPEQNQSVLNIHEEDSCPSPVYKYWKTITRIVIIVFLVTLVIIAFAVFDAEERLEDLLEWIDENKTPGFFIFVLAYVLATVLFIPGSLMSLGAGFVFGIVLGALAVWIGAVIGEVLLLSRLTWFTRRLQGRHWASLEAGTYYVNGLHPMLFGTSFGGVWRLLRKRRDGRSSVYCVLRHSFLTVH